MNRQHFYWVAIGAAAGLAKFAQRYLDGKKIQWRQGVAEVVVGMFVGWVGGQVANFFKPGSIDAGYLCAALAGWMGSKAITLISRMVIRVSDGAEQTQKELSIIAEKNPKTKE